MEIIVNLVVGVLGAGATVYAAYVQVTLGRERERASENPVRPKPQDQTRSKPVQPKPHESKQVLDNETSPTPADLGTVNVTLIFPGHACFVEKENKYTYNSVDAISLRIDSEHIGDGNGADGFRHEFNTGVGLLKWTPVFGPRGGVS